MTEEHVNIFSTTEEAPSCSGGCSGGDCSSCHSAGSCLRGLAADGWSRTERQLNVFDYRSDIPGNAAATDLVEVQFKNTRKAYFRNDNRLPLFKGDMVAVESSPGHDIGIVSLTGSLVPLAMSKAGVKMDSDFKRIYRKARPADLEKYEEAKSKEQQTMIGARQIAKELELQMKIGDVEYQGDGLKAIFYYISDQRVDFRKLIRVLADTFHIRVEMKQIGARQEAGRIGGFGPCGRELCCATWKKNFSSVSTSAARMQDLSTNPNKLAGQCAKLKCCLNFEVDQYIEAQKKLPSKELTLETEDATYYFFKADILAGLVSYSTDKRFAANIATISAERAFEVIRMNKEGIRPATLEKEKPSTPPHSVDLAEQESITRFDKQRRKKKGTPTGKTPSPAPHRAERTSAPRQEGQSDRNNRHRRNSNPRSKRDHRAATRTQE